MMRSVIVGPRAGKAANKDPKLTLMRSANAKVSQKYTLLGYPNPNRRPVSLVKVSALAEIKEL
jgi:hypothetical protein